ncbi:MAG TPA: family 78 glycoside hydrolase catalytic domain [Microbacterium sp.]|nr:family 78 glycoside hydrolase catalytic domain [Microbacterium sp.]
MHITPPIHSLAMRRLLVSALAVIAVVVALMTQGSPAVAAAAPAVALGSLTTNGRTDPLGIPAGATAFGWKLSSDLRAQTQSAYEIQVGTAPGSSDVWATGKVTSSAQTDIAYTGPALHAATQYHWRVRVWDSAGTATDWVSAVFETGLLDASDWGDAAWIGRDSAYSGWTDYGAEVSFTLNSVAFGTFLRATSASNAYMWQVNVGTSATSVPSLVPHRLVKGVYTPLTPVDLRSMGFTREQLLAGTHTIRFDISGQTLTTFLDGTRVDTRSVSDHGFGGVGIRTYGAESVTVHALSVTDADGAVLAEPDFAVGNPFSAGSWTPGAVTVSGGADALLLTSESNAPLLRRSFAVDGGKTVRSARVYAAAHGLYELSLNGEKIGDQQLAPGYTEYATRIQSQTYDVTALLASGENVLGASLGDGWWAGKVGLEGKGPYGSELAVVARLHVTYTDGSDEWIDTGADWEWAPGPFVATDLQLGENYDARAARPGWNAPGRSTAGWSAARVLPSDTAKLSPQPDEPVRETQVLDVVGVTHPREGLAVYDLGQNMVGVSRITMTGTAGQTVTIRHAEVLNPDGTLYTDNLRAALATDRYTFAADGEVTYQPTFTQHGFRYIEISGLDPEPAATNVHGVVWGSDLASTGSLETSDPMLDQLLSNIRWGARGNFVSIPTDTPARDERLGWTGDINVFSPTASYLFDMRAFLGKWMQDVRDEQKPDGQIPAVVPSTNGMFDQSGPGWQEAVISVPYALYRAYGDLTAVRENWSAMNRFYDFAARRIGDDNLGTHSAAFFTNDDWLSLEATTGVSNEVKSTAIWADAVRMMAEMADALDDPRADEFAARFAAIKGDFVAAYVADDGTVAGRSQTGYALALGMGLVEDAALRAKTGDRFAEKLALSGNHLATGFIGTPYLLPALSAVGRDDLAYELLLKKDYPSWGYEISRGATTVWERWNSIQPDGSFGPVDMNSFNHYAYGAVADWMHQNVGGIRIGAPGYRSSIIEPRPGGGVTSAKGSIDTVYGALSSDWRLTDAGLHLDTVVPVNTTATVRLKAADASFVTESGTALDQAPGVTSVRSVDGGIVEIEVGSGAYSFEVSNPLTIGEGSVESAGVGHDVLVVLVTNHGSRGAQVQATADVPSGWGTVPSALVALAPGESTALRVPVTHPLDSAAGAHAVPISVTDRGAILAEASATVVIAEPSVPPTETTTDHVDFGDPASESAHAVAASATSGISVEAGLTRRYSHNGTPGSWFSARVAAEPGEPFLLRMRETWNSPGTKDYDVLIDGELAEHVRLTRTASGQGVSTHQLLVADPTMLEHDGTVEVTFRYPESNGARQYYDPSIADVWVVPAADHQAPALGAAPAGDAPFGEDGGFTGPVDIAVSAADAVDPSPVVRVSLDGAQWQTYKGVVTVAGRGAHELRIVAEDRAGNVSEEQTLSLSITGGPAPLDITATSTARCVAGKAVVVVSVSNRDGDDAGVTVTTPWGAIEHRVVSAGRTQAFSFATRTPSIPAAEAKVEAATTGDGETRTALVDVEIAAKTCG